MRMIDADALIKTIAGKIAEFETIDDCTAETLRKCKAIIEKQPSIDAVPVVHGQWERIPLNAPDDRYGMNKYNMRIKCTACGFVTSSDFIGFNYCHCCGAKLDAPDGGVV